MKNTKYLLILVLTLVAGGGGFWWTKNNIDQEKVSFSTPAAISPTTQPAPNYEKTLGQFMITDKEICQEKGKPLVYFFGSSSCPHCVWEKPVAQKVFNQFKNEIVYHENYDNTNDEEVFRRYADINPGYVPFLVLGCKYARVGAGENLGATAEESKKLEEEALTAIVCKVTGNKPASVCNSLKAKVSEIK